MSETTKVEQKKEEQKTYTAEGFAREYQSLCEKTGFKIVVNPAWMSRDDGTYSVVLQTSVGKLLR